MKMEHVGQQYNQFNIKYLYFILTLLFIKMQMNITFLANVKPGPLNYIICVRVSRMWEFRGRDEENEIRHLDLVVIDQKVKISFKLFISLPNFEYCNSPTIFLHINICRLNYMEITSLYFYLQGYSMYAEIPPDAIPLLQPLFLRREASVAIPPL